MTVIKMYDPARFATGEKSQSADTKSAAPVQVTTILLLAKDQCSAELVMRSLSGFDHELLLARSASEVVAQISEREVSLVVLPLGGTDSETYDLCRFLKQNQPTQFLPVFTVSREGSLAQEMRALDAGADEFLVLPLKSRSFQARIRATLKRRRLIDSIDDSENVLFSLAQSVESRDPDLGQHCHRLALMAAAIGLKLRLSPHEIQTLQRSGYLHDIGKVAVPDSVLFKSEPLTESEWRLMQTHAERGERICSGMKSLKPVLPVIRHHHERWDGSGYPDGLRGDKIPLLARILQLADIYDALTTVRPYKRALTPEQAVEVIEEETRRGWRDPQLAAVFTDLFPIFRSLPLETDRSNLSLHALAECIAQSEAKSAAYPRKPGAEFEQEWRMVCGF